MKFLKWSMIASVATAGAVVAYRFMLAARERLVRGLAKAERITAETRRTMERTREALDHTERAIQGVRSTVS
jgi:hypothetical protein